jgi:hypothetical protein
MRPWIQPVRAESTRSLPLLVDMKMIELKSKRYGSGMAPLTYEASVRCLILKSSQRLAVR